MILRYRIGGRFACFDVNYHEVTGGTEEWTFDIAAMCGEFDFAAMCGEW